jgi:hypothetical protein
VISTPAEYGKAREQLQQLTRWLSQVDGETTAPCKNLTAASIVRMIARLQAELGEYEAKTAPTPPKPEQRDDANAAGTDPPSGEPD